MCVPSKTLCPTLKGFKSGFLVFHRDCSQECCHGNNIVGVILFLVMCISGAKFEECCSNISGDILDSVFYCLSGTTYDVITFLICIIKKR